MNKAQGLTINIFYRVPVYFFTLVTLIFSSQSLAQSITYADGEKARLIWFVEEIVLNAEEAEFPIKINDDITMTGMYVEEVDQVLYAVQNLVFNFPKKDIEEGFDAYLEWYSNQAKQNFCSSIGTREYQFIGFSKVGQIARLFDKHGVHLADVVVDLTVCS